MEGGPSCLIECEPLHYQLAEATHNMRSVAMAWAFQLAGKTLKPSGFGLVSVKSRILQAKERVELES